jgi:hypothetical protein
MFLSPLTQAFAYSFTRLIGGDSVKQAESLVRQLMTQNKEYWNFHTLLDPTYIKTIGEPVGKPALQQLAQVCQQPTAIDFIFKLIPTFTPAPHASYQGYIDFMVNNRWCFDFITFSDRMTPGVVAPYPIEVPAVDWLWMGAAPLVVLACVATWMYAKRAAQPKTTPAQPVASTT